MKHILGPAPVIKGDVPLENLIVLVEGIQNAANVDHPSTS